MTKYLIIDTETTNTLDDPFYYDLGFAVVDTDGKVYEVGSFVNADIFLDTEMMSTAYFVDKVPMYWAEIKAGKRKLARHNTIRKAVHDVMKRHNIKAVVAHNARFDYRSTNYTQRLLTSSKYRYFFPYDCAILDTLKMSRSVFGKDEAYKAFCEAHDYKCKNGTPRFTAEVIYRFLTDNEFVEEHTALEDVLIEKEIFAECLRRDPSINGKLWG